MRREGPDYCGTARLQVFERLLNMSSVTSDLVCAALDECDRINEGHTAWMLVATGFVLLCVPSKLHSRVRTHTLTTLSARAA